MRKVLWNNRAKLDYFENINFLLDNWTENEAQQFINEVNHIEHILSIGNVDFQDTDFAGVKRLVVRKQITLFYKILDSHTIELLRFWNNNNNKDVNKLNLK